MSRLTLDNAHRLANSAHQPIYIALPCCFAGTGVRLYTSFMPYSANANGPFQPGKWHQASYVRTAVVGRGKRGGGTAQTSDPDARCSRPSASAE